MNPGPGTADQYQPHKCQPLLGPDTDSAWTHHKHQQDTWMHAARQEGRPGRGLRPGSRRTARCAKLQHTPVQLRGRPGSREAARNATPFPNPAPSRTSSRCSELSPRRAGKARRGCRRSQLMQPTRRAGPLVRALARRSTTAAVPPGAACCSTTCYSTLARMHVNPVFAFPVAFNVSSFPSVL